MGWTAAETAYESAAWTAESRECAGAGKWAAWMVEHWAAERDFSTAAWSAGETVFASAVWLGSVLADSKAYVSMG